MAELLRTIHRHDNQLPRHAQPADELHRVIYQGQPGDNVLPPADFEITLAFKNLTVQDRMFDIEDGEIVVAHLFFGMCCTTYSRVRTFWRMRPRIRSYMAGEL